MRHHTTSCGIGTAAMATLHYADCVPWAFATSTAALSNRLTPRAYGESERAIHKTEPRGQSHTCAMEPKIKSEPKDPCRNVGWMNGGQTVRTIEKLGGSGWLCHPFVSRSQTIWRASCSMSLARNEASNSSNGKEIGSAVRSK